jgi:formate hydrogenlyase transcriptional activator
MTEKKKIEELVDELARLEQKVVSLQHQNSTMSNEKKMLDEILNELPSTFYIWDDTPQLICRNKRHDEITEYSEDDYLNMGPMDFFDEVDHARVAAAMEEVFTKGETVVEATLVTRSGKKIPHLYTAVRTIVGGKPVLMGFGIDISKQKQAEQRLHDALATIGKLKDQLEEECVYLGEEIKQIHDYENIIGQSEVMQYVFYNMKQIAPTDTTVFIQGESGTGKELIARAIHHGSKRNQLPLIKVDCSSLPANLIESELFGHEKGAFTSASEKRIGRFELADGGTIFLDEIGELPLELQPKLLRILQDGEFERLGSSKTRHTNVRVIAATNRNLEEEVQQGRFRKDLWYRINVFPLTVPPLRERGEDISLLANWMTQKHQRSLGKQITKIPIEVLNDLQSYSWPGNVRELENVIERSVIVTSGNKLRLACSLKGVEAETKISQDAPIQSLAELEKEHILRVLTKTHWKIAGKGCAAELLGLNASTLRGRMRKHAISRPKL